MIRQKLCVRDMERNNTPPLLKSTCGDCRHDRWHGMVRHGRTYLFRLCVFRCRPDDFGVNGRVAHGKLAIENTLISRQNARNTVDVLFFTTPKEIPQHTIVFGTESPYRELLV